MLSKHGCKTRGPRVSQFCKPLQNILSDRGTPSILDYWVQFVRSRNSLHLLQFWFSVASFQNTFSTSFNCQPPLAGCHNSFVGNKSQEKKNLCSVTTAHSWTCQSSKETEKHQTPVRKAHSCQVDGSRDRQESPRLQPSVNPEVETGGRKGERLARKTGQTGDMQLGDKVCVLNRATGETGPPNQTNLSVVADAMGIYTTYIALNALTPIGIPDDIRQKVEINISPEDGIIDRTCFDAAQSYIFRILENRYYPEFLRSSFLCKYQLELVSSGRHCLLDFLLGEHPISYFMEFMEQENALPLFQFWLTAESFHTHMLSLGDQSDRTDNTQDAIALYEKYFSLQATEPLGLGDAVRTEVESRICDERGVQADCFVAAQCTTYDRMNETFYPGFLESGTFLKFLDDLLCMVKSTPDLNQHESASEAESISRSACNNDKNVTESSYIDIDDPDSLWKQPKLLMRLGYLDDMGQYHSEVPLLTRKSHKKFKRFKNRHEEEEWELAIKISRRIVTKVLKRTSRTVASK